MIDDGVIEDGAIDAVDREVFRRAQGGDLAAFAEIVRALQRPALRLATIVSGDAIEAHDIVQDAFVRVFRGLPSLRDSAALRAWVLRAVANQAKNARRSGVRRDRRRLRAASVREPAAATPEQYALDALRSNDLLRAMQRLPERDREILACRYLAELSERETAAALGVAAGTVKSRTARALRRLRDEYEEGESR